MIDIIAELNDHLHDNDIESHSFSVSMGSEGFIIELDDLEYGSTYVCFNSNENEFDKDIEDEYENNMINYYKAVTYQVKRNISKQVVGLITINNVLTKM